MIGTFINHCNETIRAVDLSHTSFSKLVESALRCRALVLEVQDSVNAFTVP